MKLLKQTTLAAAITSALALGMSGQASADLYAGSSLHITNLQIGIGQPGFDQAGNPVFNPAFNNVNVDSFNFTITNTSALNNVLSGTTNTCGGVPGSNNCGAAPGDTLYAGQTNAIGSDALRGAKDYAGADSTFRWLGIGAGTNWSGADSIIHNSELTNVGTPTSTDQIAESKISSSTSASATTTILSQTGFTFTFTTTGPNPVALDLSFQADPDMIAQILNDTGYIARNAQADMSVILTLSDDNNFGVGAQWKPSGDSATLCSAVGGLSCLEMADAENLNTSVGTHTDNTADTYSNGPNVPGLGTYHIFISGLTAGQWTLNLQAKTSTNLTHTPVPEPGMLALLGIGLAGLGFMTRRRK